MFSSHSQHRHRHGNLYEENVLLQIIEDIAQLVACLRTMVRLNEELKK